MRSTPVSILLFFLSSCFDSKIKFEKSYYEKISRIKFPGEYKVLEAFDNGEWLTGTVFKIDSLSLRKFITDNQFDTLKNIQDIHLFSENYLIKYKPNITSTHNIYYVSKSAGKNNVIYVADLNSNILWTEISYPDWGGN